VQMGVIKQEANFNREVAGVRIAELSNKEVRENIANEIRGLQFIMDRFGDKPMAEVTSPTASALSDPTVTRIKH
jgi:hypothetical protein